MSWFSNLFTSPRERAAKPLYEQQMGQYSDLLSQVKGLNSPYTGINSGNLYSTFGVKPIDVAGYQKDVANTYSPLYQNLATSMAKARQSTGNAQRSTNATPALSFNPITGSYASALNQLQSEQGQQSLQGYQMQIQQQQFMANLLNSVFGNQQNFGFQKLGAQQDVLGGENQAIGNYLGSLSNTSTFGDILSGLGTAAQVATAVAAL